MEYAAKAAFLYLFDFEKAFEATNHFTERNREG
jgi:hypothetical protein